MPIIRHFTCYYVYRPVHENARVTHWIVVETHQTTNDIDGITDNTSKHEIVQNYKVGNYRVWNCTFFLTFCRCYGCVRVVFSFVKAYDTSFDKKSSYMDVEEVHLISYCVSIKQGKIKSLISTIIMRWLVFSARQIGYRAFHTGILQNQRVSTFNGYDCNNSIFW